MELRLVSRMDEYRYSDRENGDNLYRISYALCP